MPAYANLSDAELVYRLMLLRQHGSQAKAAQAMGIGRPAFGASVQAAKARGLTADSKVVDAETRLRTEVKMLKAELAARDKAEVTAAEIRQTILELSATTPAPPRWVLRYNKAKSSGIPTALWSDWHYGEKVSRAEVGGVNRYDRAVAKARVRTLVETTIDLAKNHMTQPKYPGAIVALGGDMMTGEIHDELKETNDGSVQQSVLELEELLIWSLERMADAFGKLLVPCVVGNHARGTPKVRFKQHVIKSHEWGIYCRLERHFKRYRDTRIQFQIPEENYARYDVAGHRYLLTHGDMLGVRGGDGIIGALGPITRGRIKLGRREATIGRDFDTLAIGHWHTYIPRSDANSTIVNGCLIGYNEYAHSGLVVPYSRPSQSLWFTHPKHGVTASWPVYLEDTVTAAQTAPWVQWQGKIAA